MTAQVAASSPARIDALDKLQGSRRSILANMSPPRSSHSELAPDEGQPQSMLSTSPEQAAAPVASIVPTNPGVQVHDDDDEEVASPIDNELSTPMGKTDTLLRSRSKSTKSFVSGLRRKSTAKDTTPEPPLTGINGGYTGTATNKLQVPGGASNGNGNGSMNRLRRRLSNLSTTSKQSDDGDRASIHSNLSSHREAISSFIRRSRSRSTSKEPEETASTGRRSSIGGVGRRASLKIPGLRSRKGSNAQDDEEVPPVPKTRSISSSAAPEGYPASTSDSSRKGSVTKKTRGRTSSETSSSGGTKANGSAAPAVAATNTPGTPSRKGRRASADKSEKAETQQNGEAEQNGSQSYLGAATAAVAGAGAAVGGTAAAIVSKVTGTAAEEDGYQSESDDDDDVFHDADLTDIHEGDEDEEEDDEATGKKAKGRAQPQSAYHRAGRSRGMSEASGTESKRSHDDGERDAGGAAAAAAAGGTAAATTSSRGPSKLKGTSGAKRRAGSDPPTGAAGAGGESPSDAKAKKEVPAEVREKSAKVSKLRFDDVTQTTERMNEDLDVARKVLDLFLNSRMIEAEEIIKQHADSRMYYALGFGLIATIKGFMTFEPQDLAIAISYCRDSMNIANLLRKQSNAVSNLGRFVRGTGHGPAAMAQMTPVQRHAELVYAESMLLKAVLGIVHSGDVFSFVAEALNMRTAYGIYRSLGKYVETADGKAGGFDKSIDEDFRSGTFLGNGLISLILGLLPSKVLKIMDVFGYTGDTKVGLDTLMRPGGWSQSPKQKKPKMDKEHEGIRRSICDMSLLLYHLVLSSFLPVTGVDVPFAERILDVHLARYPESVFFLFFSGRLYSTQALPEQAIVAFEKARKAQDEYRELQNLCHWDSSLCRMSLSQWPEAQECFSTLLDSSNWSPCVYAYGKAANTLQHDPTNKEAAATMAKVPSMMQRIAGKSIPLEKFVAKKAHQFNEQGHLLLPGIEFSYAFHCLSNAPRWSLTDEQLVAISDALTELNEIEDPSQYKGGVDAYWDDLALCHFLRGVTLRYIAHPEKHSKVKPAQPDIPVEEAEEQAILSLNAVIENGHKIHHCTQYLYFSRYELGRLYAVMGQTEKAVEYLELVLSGKQLEDKGNRSTKHKYPLQNMCLLRSNGALTTIKQG